MHRFGGPVRDVLHDLARVEAAVLDEPAAGLKAAAHGAREVDARAARLEGRWVEHRRPIRVVRDSISSALEKP